MRSKDKYETMDQTFFFYFLIFISRIVKQLSILCIIGRKTHLWLFFRIQTQRNLTEYFMNQWKCQTASKSFLYLIRLSRYKSGSLREPITVFIHIVHCILINLQWAICWFSSILKRSNKITAKLPLIHPVWLSKKFSSLLKVNELQNNVLTEKENIKLTNRKICID